MLHRQQALGQRLGRVAFANVDCHATDDRPGIQSRRDEMHAGIMLALACFEYALMRMQSAVAGQERRVIRRA